MVAPPLDHAFIGPAAKLFGADGSGVTGIGVADEDESCGNAAVAKLTRGVDEFDDAFVAEHARARTTTGMPSGSGVGT